MSEYKNETLLDMFLFESSQLLEQLEQIILHIEKEGMFNDDTVNEIFRIMHTIKGSASMMLFDNIATLAHSLEDVFYYIREEKPNNLDCSELSDLVLSGVDFIKIEIEKINNGKPADNSADNLVLKINAYLIILKQYNSFKPSDNKLEQEELENQQYYISPVKTENKMYNKYYKAEIYFEEGCEMENIRAYTITHNLKRITNEFFYIPEDIIENDESIEAIRKSGFHIYFQTNESYEKIEKFFLQTIFLKDLEVVEIENDIYNQIRCDITTEKKEKIVKTEKNLKESQSCITPQSIISVNILKLDKLMDLVGEMVIAEAMVIQNPDLNGLELSNFSKAARQLNKITSEIQDMVMSIRMVPLNTTFNKMHRIVRDMSKKLGKEVKLEIIGEDTEVDKNIIEHISDPLMHLVRNAIDHGIESVEERLSKGKSKAGTIILEARNAGSDVLIIVKDDGKGLCKEKILKKARENGLLFKSEDEMTDKEIFNLILLPGFSTKESVTEFSGRGVGMDVVTKNIETVGGSLTVDSANDKGSNITLKIPLTLAIIDGMNIKVGNSRYTVPIMSIRESFRPGKGDVITDPDGNEMIMVRGECYQILRLHELFKVKTKVTDFTEGIIIMVENDDKLMGFFADELLGQQQVVVKTLPEYIHRFKKINGLAGCTLLGDGNISLILDIAGLLNK